MGNSIVLAEFQSPGDLLNAAKSVHDAGIKHFETYSPFPIHGMDDAMGLGQSKLGWIVLMGGLTGLSAGFALQTWVSTSAYKIVYSGKPLFSYQAFVPVTFEIMILFSSFAAVFGMFALNKLPEWYHKIFNSVEINKATDDGFFLSIDATDENEKAAIHLLEKIGGKSIKVIR